MFFSREKNGTSNQSESQSLNDKFVETKSLQESFFSIEERTKVRKLNSDNCVYFNKRKEENCR